MGSVTINTHSHLVKCRTYKPETKITKSHKVILKKQYKAQTKRSSTNTNETHVSPTLLIPAAIRDEITDGFESLNIANFQRDSHC